MKNKKKHISEFHENFSAQLLIEKHTIGSIRNKADLDSILCDCHTSVNFALFILEDFSGTQKEKIEYLKKVKEDLKKFKIKENEQ